ncbi:TPA: PTS sugar transporter subunit IIC [Streptococcus suis]|nr:PTS sugar transporter subunit IIC [Streptococcus suis]
MSDITLISAILVVIVAFFAGLEGILDEFQFHQPLVACTLIGLVTGNLAAGVMLGGSLQMIALGFAFAAISKLTLIALGVIGVAIALIYLNLSKQGGSGNGGASSNDPIGDILEDY